MFEIFNIKTTFFLSNQKCALGWHFNGCLKDCSGSCDSSKDCQKSLWQRRQAEDILNIWWQLQAAIANDIQWQRLTFAGMAVSMLTYYIDLKCLKHCSLVFFFITDGHCHCITRSQFQHWRLNTYHIQITPMVLKIQNLKKKGTISPYPVHDMCHQLNDFWGPFLSLPLSEPESHSKSVHCAKCSTDFTGWAGTIAGCSMFMWP